VPQVHIEKRSSTIKCETTSLTLFCSNVCMSRSNSNSLSRYPCDGVVVEICLVDGGFWGKKGGGRRLQHHRVI